MSKLLSIILVFIALCIAGASTVLAAANAMTTGPSPAEMKMMMKPGPKHAAGLPGDVVPVFGCIPSMGYHYANLKHLPFGPIYGWYNGKPTFTEVMITPKAFAQGSNWNDQLKPLAGYQIDHVDIWFEPRGHPGYPVPHYDIHAWYIPHAAHMTFCGNKSGMRPAWL